MVKNRVATGPRRAWPRVLGDREVRASVLIICRQLSSRTLLPAGSLFRHTSGLSLPPPHSQREQTVISQEKPNPVLACGQIPPASPATAAGVPPNSPPSAPAWSAARSSSDQPAR